jgi:hypothetical protein
MRHEAAAALRPFWTFLGDQWRSVVGVVAAASRLPSHRPLRAVPAGWIFAFSDFAHWGGHHNEGFDACVEACRGRRCVFDVGRISVS